MKQIPVFFLIVISGILLASIYGIVHDQITYSISPEYYTKFKFYQFGLLGEGDQNAIASPRIGAFWVGILATWWMGALIGIILGLVGLVHKQPKKMYAVTVKALFLVILIALATGFAGLVLGKSIADGQSRENFANWYFPENLIDYKNFVAVGMMHTFGYLGGLLGTIFGIMFSLKQRKSNPGL